MLTQIKCQTQVGKIFCWPDCILQLLTELRLDENEQNITYLIVRPQVSLTAPNRNHFARVSLTVFWMQLPKLKN